MVDIDAGQFGQALHNILINARQACQDTGKVVIQVENEILSAPCTLPLPAGNYVKISINDNGQGIPSEILGKIFDPYFTTREAGNGLGLAVANSVVLNHGGLLTATSTRQSGTTLTIYVPAVEGVPVSEPAPALMLSLIHI